MEKKNRWVVIAVVAAVGAIRRLSIAIWTAASASSLMKRTSPKPLSKSKMKGTHRLRWVPYLLLTVQFIAGSHSLGIGYT